MEKMQVLTEVNKQTKQKHLTGFRGKKNKHKTKIQPKKPKDRRRVHGYLWYTLQSAIF